MHLEESPSRSNTRAVSPALSSTYASARDTEGRTGPVGDTICHRLLRNVRERADAPAFFVCESGKWRPTSWAEYGRTVSRAARALIALGVEPGQTVCILGFNRPEWIVMDLACMAVGGAPAGIYTTCSPEEVGYIVSHAASPVVLVENAEQYAKVKAQRKALADLKHVVAMRGANGAEGTIAWDDFLALGDAVPEKAYLDRVAALEPDGLATLIYTSGTTGPPKGVMLSHENLAWTARAAADTLTTGPDDCSLSYLPLSHIAEQMFTIHAPITMGSKVYFAESLDALGENLKAVQPTIFFGVPRIWEKLHSKVEEKLAEATGAKSSLLSWAQRVGERVTALRAAGQLPTGASYWLAEKLIFSKIKHAIGLGRARVCAVGAAPIALEVLEFFASLDVPLLEIYGQSEGGGPTTLNRPGRFVHGTVGPALPGVDVRLAEDGEVLLRGPNVFMGYYGDEAATRDCLRDGWLHSGDLGTFDGEFLKIVGRKKEIIITAGGKNITPRNIEDALKRHALIGEAVVIGDRRKYLTALVTLDAEAAATWASQAGRAATHLHEDKNLQAELQRHVDEVNTQLARVEQIKRFTIVHRPFSVEAGELTPTLKLKRRAIDANFATEVEAMYV